MIFIGQKGWPGQSSNPVGYAAAPGYPGSLTTKASGTFSNNTTYNFLLVDGGTSPPSINATGCTFNGCYFGASTNVNNSESMMTYPNGGHHTFNYCTFAPSPAQVGGAFPPMPPGGGGYTNWPTASYFTYDGTPAAVSHGISAALGNDYGIVGAGSSTPSNGLSFYYCDTWGCCNGVVFSQTNASNPLIFDNCWIHDSCVTPSGAHTDGIGDVQSANGDFVEFLIINHCTIATVGNSNALAIQANNDLILNNIQVTNNYFTSTCSYSLATGAGGLTTHPTNYVFTGNVYSNFITPQYGVIYDTPAAEFSMSGSGNKWRNNKILPGNYQQVGNVKVPMYLWPDATANFTDWTGAF